MCVCVVGVVGWVGGAGPGDGGYQAESGEPHLINIRFCGQHHQDLLSCPTLSSGATADLREGLAGQGDGEGEQ